MLGEAGAELVTKEGGRGIAVRVDHSRPDEVEALFARVRAEAGRLDVLVNDVWGGDALAEWKPFWTLDVAKGFELLDRAVRTHVITGRYGAPLMVERRSGLRSRMAITWATAARSSTTWPRRARSGSRSRWRPSSEPHGVTALAVTPGLLRSEAFSESETPRSA
jgi:NAD(P)-dependent dehydrogenase (short-subunit alcohol dehydrogenase family)